jgi:hypothetical protein
VSHAKVPSPLRVCAWNVLTSGMPRPPPDSFTVRYCNGHQGPFGWDASGVSHEGEFRMVVETLGEAVGGARACEAPWLIPCVYAAVMIRRMKNEVLSNELPEKQREVRACLCSASHRPPPSTAYMC